MYRADDISLPVDSKQAKDLINYSHLISLHFFCSLLCIYLSKRNITELSHSPEPYIRQCAAVSRKGNVDLSRILIDLGCILDVNTKVFSCGKDSISLPFRGANRWRRRPRQGSAEGHYGVCRTLFRWYGLAGRLAPEEISWIGGRADRTSRICEYQLWPWSAGFPCVSSVVPHRCPALFPLFLLLVNWQFFPLSEFFVKIAP